MREELDRHIIAEAGRADLAAMVSRRVKLKRKAGALWGCCPFHQEKTPSFKVENNRYHCFGCGAGGDAISWLRETENLDFAEAVKQLSGKHFNGKTTETRFCGILINPDKDREAATKFVRAKAIWRETQPLAGTHGEAYLRARGIKLPPSPELRFHPKLEIARDVFHPALVARLSDARGFCCIQRIYLDPREPKKANVDAPKRTLAAMKAAAVRLREPSRGYLGLAEGVETALSAMQLYAIPVWAVCGKRYTAVDLPAGLECLTLFADPGEPGTKAAFDAQETLERNGVRNVEVVLPAAHFEVGPNDDFNDVLRART